MLETLLNESGAVRHQSNICLTCNSGPKDWRAFAERSDCKSMSKGIIRQYEETPVC